MGKSFRKNLSIILAAALLVTSCPINVFAEDEVNIPVKETTVSTEELTEETTEQVAGTLDDVVSENPVEVQNESESISVSTESEAEYKLATESDAKTEETKEIEEEKVSETTPSNATYFDCTSEAIDGIKVRVTAEEGVFPAGSKLVVKKVAKTNEDAKDIEAAVDNAKLLEDEETKEEPESYTFDIKVVDKDGNELQPKDDAEVNVSFERVDDKKALVEAKVYHLEKTDEKKIEELEELVKEANEAEDEDDFDYSLLDGEVIDNVTEGHKKVKDKAAEIINKKETAANEATDELVIKETAFEAIELNTQIKEETNVVETTTDGFSYYVVEFYYGDYEYILDGDSEIELSVILKELHLDDVIDESKITRIEVSDNTLFVPVHKEIKAGSNKYVWLIKALKAFDTEEWMKISVKDVNNNDISYEIKVTDDAHNPDDCLTFTSEASFSLSLRDDTEFDCVVDWEYLYYSTDKSTWNKWDGSTSISAAKTEETGPYNLYLYGTDENTVITSYSDEEGTIKYYPWVINSTNGKVACSGNIETLRGATGHNPSPTSMPDYCYASMFEGCTSLTTAPELPAEMLSTSCYDSMFKDCTSLTTAPELPATTIATSCYADMFYNCTSLTTAPELPAKSLKDYCYCYMFYNCTSLTTASELKATTLKEFCCMSMFEKCTNLTTIPSLPTAPLVFYGYNRMFFGCTSLKISETGTTLIFKCPNSIPSNAVEKMFANTGGSFTGTPKANGSYYLVTYNVTLDTNGGIGGSTCSNAVYGQPMPSISAPSKAGYTFEGYYVDVTDEETKYYNADGTSAKNWDKTKDTTLTAKWTANKTSDWLTFSSKSSFTLETYVTWDGTMYVATTNPSTEANWDEWDGSEVTAVKDSDDNYYIYVKGNDKNTRITDYNSWFLTGSAISCTGNIETLRGATGNQPSSTPMGYCCYEKLFEGCTSLTTAPTLPSTTLAASCYGSMFSGCTSLTTAPTLPASTLADGCYASMFSGCKSLTTAPALPVATLSNACYAGMFSGCTSLTTAPTLPATKLADNCYESMFSGCTGITTAPELPATTLASYCYRYMFNGCTSLTTAPALPATTLKDYCYEYMFCGCSALNINEIGDTKVFDCPSIIDDESAIEEMFCATGGSFDGTPEAGKSYYYLSAKKEYTVTLDNQEATTSGSTSVTANYTYDLPSISIPKKTGNVFCGYFTGKNGSGTQYYNEYGISSHLWDITSDTTLYANWKTAEKPANYLTFTAKQANSTVTLNTYSDCGDIYYSTDNGSSWAYANDKKVTLENVDDKVLYSGKDVSARFSMTGKISASGSVTSLTDGLGNDSEVELSNGCYYEMFDGCTSLITAPELPATNLAIECYENMFYNCSNLTTTPELPATTLTERCYDDMFGGCSSLTTAPALPATTLADGCYGSMFYGCTSLTTAPALPATTLAGGCYCGMFGGCTSLITAPELPATKLANSCYSGMFSGCSSLATAPTLPATTLVGSCYDYMFYDCSSLKVNEIGGVKIFDCPNTIPQEAVTDMFTNAGGAFTEGTPVAGKTYYYLASTEEYTITLNNQDAYTPGSTSVKATYTYPMPSITVPSKEGYAFDGYYSETNGSGTQYYNADGSSKRCWDKTEDATLYANWISLDSYLTFTAAVAGSKVTLTPKSGTAYYSTDNGKTWLSANRETITLSEVGDKVLYKGTDVTTNYQNKFTMSGKLSASGSVTSLTDCIGNNADVTLTDSCYYFMFGSCSALTTAPELPALTLASSCYGEMFYGCTSLTTAPTLPATTLANNCYSSMFSSCSALTTAPALPATTLADSCYSSMFSSCSALTTAPTLPATTLASSCYYDMFYGCTSLTIVPDLHATALADYCCEEMFYDCTSLTTAPALPATTLAEGCYEEMFYYCSSLTSAPALPATTLANGCYSYMFYGCSSLTTAPELPATTLANGCYSSMFYDCTSLKVSTSGGTKIFTCPSSIPDYAVEEMFTSTGGTFTGTPTADNTYYFIGTNIVTFNTNGGIGGATSSNATYGEPMPTISIPSRAGYTFEGYYLDVTDEETKYYNADGTSAKNWDRTKNTTLTAKWTQFANYLTFTAEEAGSTVKFTPKSGSIEYSTDNGFTWIDASVNVTLKNVGDKVYCRGNSATTDSSNKFVMTGKIAASGSVTSLTDENGLDPDVVLSNTCYSYMFANCTSLVSAPELPATTLQLACYNNMFKGCTSLTSAPELPATTLANRCYINMFEGCTSLLVAPELPATDLNEYCYREMFVGCTGLTTAPELPATTLAERCYSNMFNGCTSLTIVPDFPVATMASNSCNAMFNKCTSLITAPKLPSTALAVACYANMFSECTSLTTAPELPATTLVASCYYDMFSGCTSLHVSDKAGTKIFTCPDNIPTSAVANMFASTGGPYKVNPVEGDTYYNAIVNLVTLDSNGGTGGATSINAIYLEPMLAIATPSKTGYVFDGYYDESATASDSKYYNADGTSAKNWDKTEDITLTARWTGDINYLTFTAEEAGSTIKLIPSGGTAYYSVDKGSTWVEANEKTVTLTNVGDKVLYKGNNVTTDTWHHFEMTGKIAASGSVTSLTDGIGGTQYVKLTYGCYSYMFANCTSLTKAPELPPTSLATCCYSYMFYHCTRLEEAPELPATILANSCYERMFQYCTSLAIVPELKVTKLASFCCIEMFYGCSALRISDSDGVKVFCRPSSGVSNPVDDMFAETGGSFARTPVTGRTYYCANVYTVTLDNQQPMISGSTSVKASYGYDMPHIDLPTKSGYSFGGYWTESNGGGTKYYNADGTSAKQWDISSDKELYAYWIDSGKEPNYLTFTAKEAGSSIKLSPASGIAYYSTDNGSTWVPANGVTITLDKDQKIAYIGSGVVTDKNYGFTMSGKIAASGSVTSLTDGKGNDENVVLSSYCYQYMFNGCESLTSAPELTATTLIEGCYCYMFNGCTNLEEAPALRATVLEDSCYYGMFNKCASIKEAPALPATTLAIYCYYCMFNECTNLETAPTLPADTLKAGCYSGMFASTNISTAPALPAIYVPYYGYCEMFWGCTSLKEAPDLPAETLGEGCYLGMFNGCTSLEEAPALLATSLTDYCYQEMFYDCISLTIAPELPATTLATNCYTQMFDGCTSLKVSDKGGAKIFTCPTTALESSVYDMFAYTGGDFKGTPVAGCTYYLAKEILITFDTSGGIGGTTSSNATYGLPMPTISTPLKVGYTFEGYYDDINATSNETKYYNADGTSAKVCDKTENTTLYAKWIETQDEAFIIETLKTGAIADLLNEAISGQTVKLIKSSTNSDATYTVKNGVTLDVAGYRLAVKNIVLEGSSSTLADTGDGEGAVVLIGNRLIASGNPYMPLYDTSESGNGINAYRLYKYGVKISAADPYANKTDYFKLKYRVYLYNSDGSTQSKKAYDLLASGGGKLILSAGLTLTGSATLLFNYTEDSTKTYGTLKGADTSKEIIFYLSLLNYKKLAGKTITATSIWNVDGGSTFDASTVTKYYKIGTDGKVTVATSAQ